MSNYYSLADLSQTAEFRKNGKVQDVIDYVKYIDSEMDKTIKKIQKQRIMMKKTHQTRHINQ